MNSAMSATAAFVMFTMLCHAQVDPWERVKLIDPGRKVNITLTSGKSVNGRIEAWSPDGITVTQGKDRVAKIDKAEVVTIAMPAGMSRGRRAAWAAGIGGGVGAGLFSGLCAGSGDCDIHPGAMAAGAAIWIGGISAGIAALIPQHKEVVYTTKKR